MRKGRSTKLGTELEASPSLCSLSVGSGCYIIQPGPSGGSRACWTAWKLSSTELLATNILEFSSIQTPPPTVFFLCCSVHLCLGKLQKIPFVFSHENSLAGYIWKYFFSACSSSSFPSKHWSLRVSLFWRSAQTKRKLCSQPPLLTSWIQAAGPEWAPAQACEVLPATQPCY